MWIKDGTVYTLHSEIRRAVGPRIGLPANLTDSVLADQGFEPVTDPGKPETTHTEKLVEDPPAKVGGVWTRQWRKVAASPAEIDAATVAKTTEMMAERDRRIQAFFWAELLTPTVNAGQYRLHLDALRDVPAQPGFPWTVDWPVKP